MSFPIPWANESDIAVLSEPRTLLVALSDSLRMSVAIMVLGLRDGTLLREKGRGPYGGWRQGCGVNGGGWRRTEQEGNRLGVHYELAVLGLLPVLRLQRYFLGIFPGGAKDAVT